MNCMSVSREMLKGEHTCYGSGLYDYGGMAGYEDAMLQYDRQANRWSATEYNSNNAWNCNMGNGNTWNYNKYNSMVVRPVVAYDTPPDFLNLVVAAFHDCCSGKSTSYECIAYCETADEDLPLLAHELYTCTYQPGVSTCFLVKYPKYREVFAACFRDRIVHHFICLLLNPLFERRFHAQGNVSFNCRKGFGTLAAQRYAYDMIKRHTDSYRREAWVYRGDLVSFFMSIDKRVMWQKLEPFIKENYKGRYAEQVMYAARTVVLHCPERNCIFNTDITEWRKHVEAGKSLFGNDDFHGMPIGNLTTQIFANFLMSFFDGWTAAWFARHGHAGNYARFVDDFLVVCTDKPLLKAYVREAKAWLHGELKLMLHDDKYHFQTAARGVLFVGAYMKNHRMYISNRTAARFAERVHGFKDMLLSKREVTLADLVRLEQVCNSYLGFLRGKNTYDIRRRVLVSFGREFFRYCYIQGRYESVKVRQKYKLTA